MKETAVTKITPSFLSTIKDDGSLDALKEYRVLSRVKVVQGMSDPKLKETHGEGAVLLQPGGAEVAQALNSFLFVPLFFFTEFITWNDRKDTASSAIRARSFDKAGEIATKSKNPDNRWEHYEGGPKGKPFQMRHVEHLNFAGVIYGNHPLAMSPTAMQFSKGEMGTGKNLCSAAMLRNGPLWAQVWEFSTSVRTKDGDNWWGLDFRSPDNPWILEGEAELFQKQHNELKALHEQARLSVDQQEDF